MGTLLFKCRITLNKMTVSYIWICFILPRLSAWSSRYLQHTPQNIFRSLKAALCMHIKLRYSDVAWLFAKKQTLCVHISHKAIITDIFIYPRIFCRHFGFIWQPTVEIDMSITVEIEIEGREQEQEKGLQPESNWGCYMYVLGNRDAAFWEMLQLVFNLCRSNLEDQFTTRPRNCVWTFTTQEWGWSNCKAQWGAEIIHHRL